MKSDTVKIILGSCNKAIIHLIKESVSIIEYDKRVDFIALNDSDCFDFYSDGETENCHCIFYKNVFKIEVME